MTTTQHAEPSDGSTPAPEDDARVDEHGTRGDRMDRLRAAVLGANDGIISVAGVVVAVAGATAARGALLTAGLAALVAGAVSMALGEFVSVSTQRDAQASGQAPGAHEQARPVQAAAASAATFIGGGLLPLVAVLVSSGSWRIPAAGAVLAALALTGWASARASSSPAGRPVLRILGGGLLGLAVTYGVGHLVGTALT